MERSVASNRLKKLQSLLRDVRQKAGLRQVDLADRLGRPQSFVSSYETGDRCLDVLELEQVCKALGTTLGKFVRFYEEQA
jgi:transcriptional regulator with XRE-family HTH domain